MRVDNNIRKNYKNNPNRKYWLRQLIKWTYFISLHVIYQLERLITRIDKKKYLKKLRILILTLHYISSPLFSFKLIKKLFRILKNNFILIFIFKENSADYYFNVENFLTKHLYNNVIQYINCRNKKNNGCYIIWIIS